MMEIRRYESPLLRSNMYLLVEEGHALVIDPFEDTTPGQELIIDQMLVTHEHYDHISGVNAWKQHYGAPLMCSKRCNAHLQTPQKNLARYFDVFCQLQSWIELEIFPQADAAYTCAADETFEDRHCMAWMGHTVELMEIPGHSLGSIGIMVDGKHFFSGDSMMRDYPIELRFPGGNAKLWQSTGQPRLAELPAGLHIWPGHFEDFILQTL
ncbi:MAG: MBL fold metallo-hydrolase [Clostridia bacterium]|nr:MBL fold metallo-hydrolase [Clostridia bacterium]